MNSFIQGIKYLFAGFDLISKPGLRRYVIFPVIANIILFSIMFFLLRHYIGAFNFWFENHLPTWLQWLGAIIWVLFLACFFLIFIYTFSTLANIFAAPLNGLLSEKVTLYLTGKSLPERSTWQIIKDIPRMIGRQIGIILYFLPRALLLLLFFFIPLVQPIAGIIWFLFSAWLMTFTYLDYPTDNQQIALRDVREWMWQRRYMSLGFGISVLVVTMIPIVNFFVMPAAVAAATKYWIENHVDHKGNA